jgi:hypothetical protein
VIVNVTAVLFVDGSTVATARGTDEEGREVLFAADRRPLFPVWEALHATLEPVACDVEPWQILERGASWQR